MTEPTTAQIDDLREWYAEDEPEVEQTTWEPVDLRPYLRGEIDKPEPTMGIVRSDGLRLIYPGREHTVLGETESGKTWFALACVVAEVMAGSTVVYVHYEESDPGSTIERLRMLGVTAEVIEAKLRFVAPNRPIRGEWITPLTALRPSLVIHDGVNEGMALHGADIMAAEGAAAFRRRVILPFIQCGAASLACDHVPKSREGRGRDAYGSVHKGNAIDGARFLLDNIEPFGRGRRGLSSVYVTKDRPGYLRASGKPSSSTGQTLMGVLVVDDSDNVGADTQGLNFYAPRAEDIPKANADRASDAVLEVINGLKGRVVPSMRLLTAEMRKAGHNLRDATVRAAVDDLLVSGHLAEIPGKRGARGYQSLTASQRPGTGSDMTADTTAAHPPPTGGGPQWAAVDPVRPGRSGTQWDAVE